MKLEIKIGESKMNPQEQIQKGLEVEKAEHPWADQDVLQRIVMDEIKADPNAYMNGNDDDSYQEQQDGEDMRHGIGTTLCGRKGSLTMPGIVSRMGLPRCAHCCRLAGIPRGDGAPANSDIEESADGERAVTVTR